MIIHFHKISHERYRLECIRVDGSRTEAEFETRSVLRHDLTHFLFESFLNRGNSVFGQIARGKTLQELMTGAGDGQDTSKEIQETEQIVAMLQGFLRDGVESQEIIKVLQERYAAMGKIFPKEVSVALVDRIKKQYTFLFSAWQSLPTGKHLEVIFSHY